MFSPEMIAALVTPVVSLLTGYMTYRVGLKQAEKENPSSPETPKNTHEAEQALILVKETIAVNGTDDERADLASFERNPERYQDALRRALIDLAARDETFVQRLQTIAEQANLQTGGIVIRDSAKIYGPVTAENKGTINPTYNFNTDQDTHGMSED